MTRNRRFDLPSLSSKEAEILDLLIGAREKYGLELVAESKGSIRRGTVYVTLDRMEEKGFVTSRREKKPLHVPGIPRRMYRITGLGHRALAQWSTSAIPASRLVPQ